MAFGKLCETDARRARIRRSNIHVSFREMGGFPTTLTRDGFSRHSCAEPWAHKTAHVDVPSEVLDFRTGSTRRPVPGRVERLDMYDVLAQIGTGYGAVQNLLLLICSVTFALGRENLKLEGLYLHISAGDAEM